MASEVGSINKALAESFATRGYILFNLSSIPNQPVNDDKLMQFGVGLVVRTVVMWREQGHLTQKQCMEIHTSMLQFPACKMELNVHRTQIDGMLGLLKGTTECVILIGSKMAAMSDHLTQGTYDLEEDVTCMSFGWH